MTEYVILPWHLKVNLVNMTRHKFIKILYRNRVQDEKLCSSLNMTAVSNHQLEVSRSWAAFWKLANLLKACYVFHQILHSHLFIWQLTHEEESNMSTELCFHQLTRNKRMNRLHQLRWRLWPCVHNAKQHITLDLSLMGETTTSPL